MPIRKRGQAWEVTVCHAGQVVRRSSKHWTKAQARQIERKILDDLIAIQGGQQPDRTMYEAVERYVKEALPEMKSAKQTRGHLRAIAHLLDDRMLTDAPEIADQIKAEFAHLSPTTVNIRLRILRSIVGRAYKQWEWLDKPLHSRIRLLANNAERHAYLTESQVEALAAEMPIAGGYVILAAYTGIRRGHLLRLTRRDVVGDCIHLGTDSKTGQPQLIPLHPRAQDYAQKLPLCSDQDLRREWDKARAALGLKGFRFHDLRHTCASWLLQAGVDLMHIREYLGHSTIAVTQRYAHLRTEHLRDAVNRIGTARGLNNGGR